MAEEKLETLEQGSIIKSKRKSRCGMCLNPIKSRYKVSIRGVNRYYRVWNGSGSIHLDCAKKFLSERMIFYEGKIKQLKLEIKKFNKQKFKRAMMIDKLKGGIN